jgi:hypothetical protein
VRELASAPLSDVILLCSGRLKVRWGALSLAGGEISGVEDAVVVALLSSFGVEVVVSMFFSPLTMDKPLGALVSPDPDAPAAACCVVAPRTGPRKGAFPVTQTGLPSQATSSCRA